MKTVLGSSSFLFLFLLSLYPLTVTHGFSNQRAALGVAPRPKEPVSPSRTTTTTATSSNSKSRYAYEPVLPVGMGGVSSYLIRGEERPRRHFFRKSRNNFPVPLTTALTSPRPLVLAGAAMSTSDGSVALHATDWIWSTPQAPPSWRRRQQRRAPALSVQKTLSKALACYMKWLQEKPRITKSFSAAVVQAMGDLLSQRLFALWHGQSFVWDGARTASFVLAGFFFNAPFLHYWYQTIARFGQGLQQQQRKWSDNQRVGAELALDQSLGVFVYYPLYFVAYELCAAASYGRGMCQSGTLARSCRTTIL